MFIFGYDVVLERLERVIHQLVELQAPGKGRRDCLSFVPLRSPARSTAAGSALKYRGAGSVYFAIYNR